MVLVSGTHRLERPRQPRSRDGTSMYAAKPSTMSQPMHVESDAQSDVHPTQLDAAQNAVVALGDVDGVADGVAPTESDGVGVAGGVTGDCVGVAMTSPHVPAGHAMQPPAASTPQQSA